jgi:RNA polymerase sigma factor (TIGR02999 family)
VPQVSGKKEDQVKLPAPVPPPDGESGDITRLLRAVSLGDRSAFDRLVPLVYGDLSVLARHNLRSERDGHTLNTTALVHEAYLRLADQTRATFDNRHQFFAVASEAMRRILIDYAKRRQAGKRGGGAPQLPLEEAEDVPSTVFLGDQQAVELLALDDALTRLAAFHPQGAAIVQYRFFAGLAHSEIAELLGTSERSVRRSWMTAKAWLRRDVTDALSDAPTLLSSL